MLWTELSSVEGWCGPWLWVQGTENLEMGIRKEIEACRVVEGLEPKQGGPLGWGQGGDKK